MPAESPAPTYAAEALPALVEVLRQHQSQLDAERPDPLPSPSYLLGKALAARRIRTKKIAEGRWVFEFSGTVIGGYAKGVTTLVSAHSKRILADPASLWAHLDLMDVPHVSGLVSAADQLQPMLPFESEISSGPSDDAVLLQAYCVGKKAISVLAGVSESGSEKMITVDVTDTVAEEISALAVDALRAIPGLLAAGVNLQVNSLESTEGAVVIGINEAASILPHHYPQLGAGQPVADAIAEQILFTAAL